MTLTFNPLLSMAMSYLYAKVQGQRSVCSKDRVETNGQTEGQTDRGDCITSVANAVGKYYMGCVATLHLQKSQDIIIKMANGSYSVFISRTLLSFHNPYLWL